MMEKLKRWKSLLRNKWYLGKSRDSIYGSRGFPRGQRQVIYFRGWHHGTMPRNPDLTMHHCDIEELESNVQSCISRSYRPPDEVEHGVFDNPNVVALYWYYNPEDVLQKSGL